MSPKQGSLSDFREVVWRYYDGHSRDLPWRTPVANDVFDPYAILVSEIMLQQTQAARVVPKYQLFLERFPTVDSLARSELGDVLRLWTGLGYNRRAQYLWRAAQYAMEHWQGIFPADVTELARLPGVGANTAGAITAYAYDCPVVFIETNIRTVFIHHFFEDQEAVADKQLLPYVSACVPDGHAVEGSVREWYWALMDYGVYLKSSVGNASRRSRHYAKQSTFEGSLRQLRGKVIRLLGDGPMTYQRLAELLADKRGRAVLDSLVAEGMVRKHGRRYSL